MADSTKTGFLVHCLSWIALMTIYGVLSKGWSVVDIFPMCYNFCVKCHCLSGILAVCVVSSCVRINFYRSFIVESFRSSDYKFQSTKRWIKRWPCCIWFNMSFNQISELCCQKLCGVLFTHSFFALLSQVLQSLLSKWKLGVNIT